VVGWLAVAAYAVLVGGVALDAASAPAYDRHAEAVQVDAGEGFVDAWERSRLGTYRTAGTYERHSEVTGASIASEDVLAQRPPRRLHHQLGGVEGRDDDRIVLCPAPPSGAAETPPCQLGPPGGPTYAESVATEVEGLTTLVTGPGALYRVTSSAEGCFELVQERSDPRAPFGVSASFCFDDATGAPVRTRVSHEGGIVEVLVVNEVSHTVSDRDLEP
jgi:hypothetical protein